MSKTGTTFEFLDGVPPIEAYLEAGIAVLSKRGHRLHEETRVDSLAQCIERLLGQSDTLRSSWRGVGAGIGAPARGRRKVSFRWAGRPSCTMSCRNIRQNGGCVNRGGWDVYGNRFLLGYGMMAAGLRCPTTRDPALDYEARN